MKKVISLLLAAVMLCTVLCGCAPAREQEGIKIVCTIFPLYDWMRELTAGSEDVELILIADNGADMHSYQPTTGDIVDISTCDMLVYTGGESEEWVEETTERSGSGHMKKAAMLEMLGEEALCAAPHDHHDEDSHAHHHDHDAKDEHVWLSPRRAMELCAELSGMLCEMDAGNADIYRANAERYIGMLTELDEAYTKAADSASAPSLLFADRFPFRYLAADYGLACRAAFDGCEAETEAGFETVAELVSVMDTQHLDCVLIIDGSEPDLARTIIDASSREGAEILTLDSLQSVTAADIASGVTYIETMESNLEILRAALGC